MITSIFIGVILILTAGGCGFLNRPSFGRLPRGERLERIKRSPGYKDGEFRNQHPTELMTSDKGRWQSMWNFLFSKPEGLAPSTPILTVETNLKELQTCWSGSVILPICSNYRANGYWWTRYSAWLLPYHS